MKSVLMFNAYDSQGYNKDFDWLTSRLSDPEIEVPITQ